MKISTKGRYGVRAMLDLALYGGQKPILVREIAQRQQISERYLEHILISLKLAGIVKSTRGARGGFTLAKPPSQIKLSEIIKAMEGSLAPVKCADDYGMCSRADLCVTRDIWVAMKEAINSILESTTLQDLVERQAIKETTAQTRHKAKSGRNIEYQREEVTYGLSIR